MFFSSELINNLKNDHEKIREQIEVLGNLDKPMTERRMAFEKLLPVLESHVEREEEAVYAFMKSDSELKEMAYEGEEEHHIADYVVSLLNAEEDADKWSARARILSELIEHHVDEEESTVFPFLKKHLDAETDKRLSEKYTVGLQFAINKKNADSDNQSQIM